MGDALIDVWFSLLGLSYSLAHTYKFLKKLFFSWTVDFKINISSCGYSCVTYFVNYLTLYTGIKGEYEGNLRNHQEASSRSH